MRKWTLVIGITFVVLAVIVLAFAGGLRRWYSGLFFAVIGMVALAVALRRQGSGGK